MNLHECFYLYFIEKKKLINYKLIMAYLPSNIDIAWKKKLPNTKKGGMVTKKLEMIDIQSGQNNVIIYHISLIYYLSLLRKETSNKNLSVDDTGWTSQKKIHVYKR